LVVWRRLEVKLERFVKRSKLELVNGLFVLGVHADFWITYCLVFDSLNVGLHTCLLPEKAN
jgi:hypothetical protein